MPCLPRSAGMRQRKQENFRETLGPIAPTMFENAQNVHISGGHFNNNSYANNEIDLTTSMTGTYFILT
jgi:hypothetical protein